MTTGYFHRVTAQSPTRLWINNPTREEARLSIAAGAVSCTTNPTYAMKQIQREEELALRVVDRAIQETANDALAAEWVQRELARPILEAFLPLFERNPGREGFVSIQGSPLLEDDGAYIVEEAMRNRRAGKNYIAKIPVTAPGLQAIDTLIREDIPVIATEVMGIAQAIAACEVYQRASAASGKRPAFFVTHITGILDEYLQEVVRRQGIDVSPDALWQAGCIVARQQYRILQERRYPGIMLGGGARGLHHFTEMVGGEVHVTINWAGTADRLIESDPPVVYRMFCPAPQRVIDELLEKLPDFDRAYREDGLRIDEFADFGPVELFRNSFIRGWEFLLQTIRARRASRS